jgi:hypothetical protein
MAKSATGHQRPAKNKGNQKKSLNRIKKNQEIVSNLKK